MSFIGTGHDDRIPIVKNVMEQCRKNGLRCFSYFYVPHQMVFLRDKICNQYYKNVNCDITNGTTKKYLTQKILGDLRFYGNGRLVNYFTLLSGTRKRWESNIIWVNAESEDTMINRRISELNDLYRAIHDITPDFGESASECWFLTMRMEILYILFRITWRWTLTVTWWWDCQTIWHWIWTLVIFIRFHSGCRADIGCRIWNDPFHWRSVGKCPCAGQHPDQEAEHWLRCAEWVVVGDPGKQLRDTGGV